MCGVWCPGVDIMYHRSENWEWCFWVICYKYIIPGCVFCGITRCIDELIRNILRFLYFFPPWICLFWCYSACFNVTVTGSGWTYEGGQWGTSQYCWEVAGDSGTLRVTVLFCMRWNIPDTWASPVGVLSYTTSVCWYSASCFLQKRNTGIW